MLPAYDEHPLFFRLGSLGRWALGGWLYLVDLWSLFYTALRAGVSEGLIARRGLSLVGRTFFNQLRFTAYDALTLICITAVTLGTVIIIQALSYLTVFSTEAQTNAIISLITIREISPIMIALILIGRSGTAISTELANMTLNREVEALEAMGLNLRWFLAFPRIAGFTISIVTLTVYFDALALVGGYVMAVVTKIAPLSFSLIRLVDAVTLQHVLVGLGKSLVFGAIISTVCYHHGMSVKLSFREVPQVATRAVVNSMVMCFAFNTIIAIFTR